MKKTDRKDQIRRIVAMLCALLVAVALIISFIAPALAVSQKDLDDAKEKTEEAKEDLEEAEKKHKTILEEFKALDSEIHNTETEIAHVENQILQTENDIALKEAELRQAEEDFEMYKNLFLSRARVMYENSELKYLEILFGAKDFSDFLSKVEMISQLMEYDRNILANINATKESIQNAKSELEGILVRQQENLSTLENRKAILDESLAKKQALLEEASKDIEKYKMIYEAAEEEEKELIERNKAAFEKGANPVEYDGGEFQWPVPDSKRITSQYGYRIHPVYKTEKFHSGIDIGAAQGLQIVAAADGVVTLAATNGGYGKCIVINHGSGITTLYGHCSSIGVSVGDQVKKGDTTGKVGSTGVSTGPHLHFEVRVNGATRNPLDYLTKK